MWACSLLFKKTFLVSEFLAHLRSLHKLYITCMHL